LLVLKDIEGIGIVYLDDKDIVRHRLVKKVLDAIHGEIKKNIVFLPDSKISAMYHPHGVVF
jgi:phosphate starvation-inducible protein PhoH